jgi:Restriction endonuclease BglII
MTNQALIPDDIAVRQGARMADRELNNFRLSFDLRAIDAGVIITRCSELQLIFNQLGRGPSFGNSTTHMAKLLPRLDGGSGGGCPVVVFGIRQTCYVED